MPLSAPAGGDTRPPPPAPPRPRETGKRPAEDPRTRRRQTTTIAAAVVAVALAGGAVWAANSLMPPPAPAPEASASAAPPVPESVVDTSAGPRDLVSATGNLWCHFEGGMVQCAVKSVTWDAPAPACTESAAAVAVSLTGSTVGYPCVPTFPEGPDVLDRDVRYVSGDYSCLLTTGAGITCTNSEGVGFQVGADTPLTTLP